MASGRIALALRTDRLTRLRIEWARRNQRLVGQMSGEECRVSRTNGQGRYAGGFAGYFWPASQHVADTVASVSFICWAKTG